jgi:hypothetical protein
MGRYQQPRERSRAVAILATTVVVLAGLGCCSFVVLASSQDPRSSLWVCGGCFAGVVLFLWVIREKPDARPTERLPFWYWLKRGGAVDEVTHYQIAKQRRRSEQQTPQQPPTVDVIRDLADSPSTWVPASTPDRVRQHGCPAAGLGSVAAHPPHGTAHS